MICSWESGTPKYLSLCSSTNLCATCNRPSHQNRMECTVTQTYSVPCCGSAYCTMCCRAFTPAFYMRFLFSLSSVTSKMEPSNHPLTYNAESSPHTPSSHFIRRYTAAWRANESVGNTAQTQIHATADSLCISCSREPALRGWTRRELRRLVRLDRAHGL